MRPLRAAPLVIAMALACPAKTFADSSELLRAEWNSQVIQNRRADRDDLSRMTNVAMVQRFARAGLLVPVPSSTKYYYTRYIPAKYRYLRPWSKLFLDRLSSQYYARFRKRLRITSMVRTMALQSSLAKRNKNAAPARNSGYFQEGNDVARTRVDAAGSVFPETAGVLVRSRRVPTTRLPRNGLQELPRLRRRTQAQTAQAAYRLNCGTHHTRHAFWRTIGCPA